MLSILGWIAGIIFVFTLAGLASAIWFVRKHPIEQFETGEQYKVRLHRLVDEMFGG